MNKRLIWIDGDDDFSGWCCSHCSWGVSPPYLDSTVAALAFNRLARNFREARLRRPPRKVMVGLVYLPGSAVTDSRKTQVGATDVAEIVIP